ERRARRRSNGGCAQHGAAGRAAGAGRGRVPAGGRIRRQRPGPAPRCGHRGVAPPPPGTRRRPETAPAGGERRRSPAPCLLSPKESGERADPTNMHPRIEQTMSQATTTPVPAANGDADTGEFLTFVLGEEEYGVDILRVQEIRSYDAVTRLPDAPDYIKGVINLRGIIVPVVDMRLKFRLA